MRFQFAPVWSVTLTRRAVWALEALGTPRAAEVVPGGRFTREPRVELLEGPRVIGARNRVAEGFRHRVNRIGLLG